MTATLTYDKHVALDSTALSDAYFVKDAQYGAVGKLFIKFNDGRMAGYSNFPRYMFDELTSSDSAGRYWHNNIKNRFFGVSGDVNLLAAPPAPKVLAKSDEANKRFEDANVNNPELTVRYVITTVKEKKVRALKAEYAVNHVKNLEKAEGNDIEVKEVVVPWS